MTPTDLRQWRETAGLSQAGLAALLGTRQNTVSRWEIGTRAIPPYLALALRALEMTPDLSIRFTCGLNLVIRT